MVSSERIVEEVPSLCPICRAGTASVILERDGKIYQRWKCSQHEAGESLIFSDAALHHKLDAWNALLFGEASRESITGDDSSRNPPCLAVIDITNRCNYRCPICFAEATREASWYHLPLPVIRTMLESLLKRFPIDGRHIQFSGGEPTLHPEFPEILRLTRQLGFTHIQVATNGSRFIKRDFANLCEEMGLETLYLQFDGMSDDVYLRLRGQRLLDQKIAIVENIARTNMRIVLVPTIAASVNVDQIGPIFNFALQHSKHITGISVQPAADIGRVQIHGNGNHSSAFNLADLAIEFGRQTGLTRAPDDWFPLNAISMITQGLGRLRGETLPGPACDAHCSLGTYFYIGDDNKPVCITRFFDLDRFLKTMRGSGVSNGKGPLARRISQLLEWHSLSRCFDKRKAPAGMSFRRLLHSLKGWENKSLGRGPGWDRKGFNGMFVAGMHFMDSRNYNLRRVRRCIIQYVTVNQEVIPFCSYNAGIRRRTEEELSRQECFPARRGEAETAGVPISLYQVS